ncbi:MAG: arsenate reductase ArsC [Euryarchaeota archaeon]|nr:arsenate reductase ArsC [Euryarchaeota archaeon]
MKVLFVCVGNSARSQMAEAIFNKIAGKKEAQSAGTQPADKVSSKAIAVMREIGIDISMRKPKLLTREMVEKTEKIITMGCLDSASCPLFLLEDKSKLEDWKIEDPRDKPIEKVREIRDEIKRRVEGLAGEEKQGTIA